MSQKRRVRGDARGTRLVLGRGARRETGESPVVRGGGTGDLVLVVGVWGCEMRKK